MRQILQSLKDGSTRLADVPAPRLVAGQVLVRTRTSLVSSGTERMLVEFGRSGWLDRARKQPDKVRMVLDKIRSDGLGAAIAAVRSKLDQPLPLGYCNVGVVTQTGAGVEGLAVGDRVASNGKHAEMVCVPRNLCARIPDNVDDEQAAFTVVAAIGLQGIRLANPTLGECVVVTGLGLIGLLTVQMLRAQGCRVLGIDPDAERRALAVRFGAEAVDTADADAVLAAARRFSRGRGVDAVLITASSTSNEPVAQAARMCRQRGRIVLVGVVGLELSRADFYEKELSFQVSCSYGPGRYDDAYEQAGRDYPVGFVRWTEQRNFEAVLDLMAAGALDTAPLVSHRFALDQAAAAYDMLTSDAPSLGIVLEYPEQAPSAAAPPAPRASVAPAPADTRQGTGTTIQTAFLGAGNYASRVLMPAFKQAGARLHTVVSGSGVSAAHQARRHGFVQTAGDEGAVLSDPGIDAVVIATRHADHARQVLAALQAGKHVFCEKPLCLTREELGAIEDACSTGAHGAGIPHPMLMVGFNRRFAPHTRRIASLLAPLAVPKQFVMTINAGAVPARHWTQDPAVGGGRLVGEACHFIDLLRHLAGAPITGLDVTAPRTDTPGEPRDTASLSLQFADGSIGTIHYVANGHRGFPKERLEVFCAGRVLQLDNFRTLRGWGWPGFRRMALWRQDKGQAACVMAFVRALTDGGHAPIPLEQLFEVSAIAIDAQAALA